MVRIAALFATLCLSVSPMPVASQDKPGRFTMTPIEGGFLRLDTETGAISHCKRGKDSPQQVPAWICEPANDTAREEAARLRAENKKLEGDVRRMEEMILGDPKSGPPADPAPRSGPQAQFPTEQEIDRAIDELERLFRKYRDRLREFDRNLAAPSPAPRPSPAPETVPPPKSL